MDRGTGRAVIVPMDHGITMGPIEGLVDMRSTIDKVAQGGATAVVLHKGIIPYSHRSFGRDIGLIVHLSASTKYSRRTDQKILVTTVEEAIKIGADAVSMHVNIGNDYENEMLADFGDISRLCNEWGMPLMVMIYPRGKDMKDAYDAESIKVCARVGAELGADIIKTSYTGDIDSFREVVRGAQAPVVIAGGPKMGSDEDIFRMVEGALEAGATGLSIGRNAFQHEHPDKMIRALSRMVHHGDGVSEALKVLKS